MGFTCTWDMGFTWDYPLAVVTHRVKTNSSDQATDLTRLIVDLIVVLLKKKKGTCLQLDVHLKSTNRKLIV